MTKKTKPYSRRLVNDPAPKSPTATSAKALLALDDKAAAEFWSHVAKRSLEDCWPWLGAKDVDGYALFRGRRGNRVALALAIGEIPAGLHALHTCHNRSCVNPGHLYAGTAQQNAVDRVRAGRQARPIRKLDPDRVRTMRHMYSNGVPQRFLARWFGVCQHHVRSTVNRNKWPSVADIA